MRSQVCHKIESADNHHKTDKESLQHIALGNRENHWENVEHSGKRCERKEFISGKNHSEDESDRNQEQRHHESGRMAEHKRRTHSDADTCRAFELTVNQRFGRLRNRFETFDKERCDARDEFHHRTDFDAQTENIWNFLHQFAPTCARQTADDDSDDDSKEEWLSEESEFLFHTLSVDVQFVKARNLVETGVDCLSKWHKSLAERLRNGYSLHTLIESLEFGCGAVGKDKGDDIADNRREKSPENAVHRKIDHRSDEGEMPIVPKVDVDRAGGLCQEHQKVHSKADRDYERTDGSVVGNGCGSRPSHIEDLELKSVNLHHLRKCRSESAGEKSSDDRKSDESHSYEQTAFERLSGLDSDANA